MSEFRGYKELKEIPEAKDYRSAMAASLRLAKGYDGTEDAYRGLMESLERLEEVIETSPSVQAARPLEKEREAARAFAPIRPREINDVLSVAIDARGRSITRALENEEDTDSGLYVRKIEGVILPPSEGNILHGEHAREFEPARFEERLKELLTLLEELHVYADDLIVTKGRVSSRMMREQSYVGVEIPRLSRTVLVCDQVGEATFVLKGYVPQEVLLRLTKEQLQEQYSDDVRKIIRVDAAHWQKRIQSLLSGDEAWKKDDATDIEQKKQGNKIDVRNLTERREHFCSLVRDIYTPESWRKMPDKDKRVKNPEINLSLSGLATLFGVSGDPKIKKTLFLELGTKIWPEDEEMKQQWKEYIQMVEQRTELEQEQEGRTPEEWRKVIQEYYTPQSWRDMPGIEKRASLPNVKVGLAALSTLFSVSEYAQNDRTSFLELGTRIWPEDEEMLRQWEASKVSILEARREKAALRERSVDDWRSAIHGRYTPESWRAMSKEEKNSKLPDLNVGLNGLAMIFSVPGNPRSQKATYLELGTKIWPDDEEMKAQLQSARQDAEQQARQHEGQKKRTKEEWLTLLHARFTPASWRDMSHRERSSDLPELHIGSNALARILGVRGNASAHKVVFLELGTKIWPEDEEMRTLHAFESRTSDDWRVELHKHYTPDSWRKMPASYRRSKLPDLDIGLLALARIFGAERSPVFTRLGFLELGTKIWPDDQEMKRQLAERKENRG